MTATATPGVLLVLDGWGHSGVEDGNALARAHTPVLDALRAKHPSTVLSASGEAVGLLPGTVGNSEIGHLVIGAGRPLLYDSLLVQRRIDSGQLRDDPQLGAVADRLAASDKALHLVGLCSDGQIHAHVEHLATLLAAAAAHRVPRVWIHAITDGRDVADGTADHYLARVQELTAQAGCGRIATITGRGYALDKAGNLDLTQAAGLAIADGTPHTAQPPGSGDEWMPPTVLAAGPGGIHDGDALLFFNFRSDRIQQLADFLLDHLAATGRTVQPLSLAQYDTRHQIPALVGRADASGGLADELEAHGLRSVRIAEKEKFEHVTYYVNGRNDRTRTVEEHVLVAGDNPPDYRARPEMNLDRVADEVITALQRPDVALVVANLANIDVVGHTGDHDATVLAAQHTDQAVDRITQAAGRAGRWVLLVGDHGNAEQMTKPGPDGTPRPYGGHTTNPVPAVLVPAPGHNLPEECRDGGTLADIAPTVLSLLGRPAGDAMTGRPLL